MSKSGAYYMDTLSETAAKLAEVTKERDDLKATGSSEIERLNGLCRKHLERAWKAEKQRDELLAALVDLLDFEDRYEELSDRYSKGVILANIRIKARAAIANCKAESPSQKEPATGNGVSVDA